MIESKDLLDWEAEGLTTAEMQTRLADEGKTVSIELVRLRLREARQVALGDLYQPPPTPPRKDSATASRRRRLAEAVRMLEELREGVDAAVEGWEDHFAGTARYERFVEASEALGVALEALEGIDFSYS